MAIGVLGPLVVDGAPPDLPRRDRVVLEALVLEPGAAVSAERLADALWPDQPPASWAKVVQSSIVRLRRTLGREAIQTLSEGYRLTLPPHEIDACEFERLVDRGREHLLVGQAERAAYAVEDALALWRGRPLGELGEWDSGRIAGDRLEELHRDAEELRVEAGLEAGRHRDLLADVRRLVRAAPLRERRWELLALAEYRAGRQGDALRTIRQVKQLLLDELGLDPGGDLLALEGAILRQDPVLAAAPEPPVSAECPYPGLVPYDVEDAEGFFGRDDDITACLRRLRATGVLAVVGPSGSGKSSLVRAGIAATRRGEGVRVVVVTPGPRPLEALRAVSTSPAGRFLLVVDQCEEALSLCDDRAEQARFMTALARYAERHDLVISLRADRLGDLAAFPDAARLVERGLYLLNAMVEDDLRAAIEAPARRAGLRVEPGLVELLIAEVGGEPGALPLLSHVLRETWIRREGAVLTVDAYRSTGGVRRAVAESAEALYERVPADERPVLRDLLLRLVSSTSDGESVPTKVPRRLVAADPARERLVELLVRARLVTSDDGVLELAHEALTQAWPRMRGWLDEDSEGQRILRHLTVAADTWQAMGRPDTELYRGVRLARALDWRDQPGQDLTAAERDFLDAGRRLAEAEERTAAQRAGYQARVNRRLRGLLGGIGILLVIALVAGWLAVQQADRASDAGRVSDARRVGAQALVTDELDRALQLAVAAVAVDDSTEARASLRSVLSRVPELAAYHPDAQGWLELSDDGSRLATMNADNRVTFLDIRSGDRVGSYDPNPPGWQGQVACYCEPLAWSPADDLLAVGILNGIGPAIRLVNTTTFEETPVQPGGLPRRGTVVSDLEFSADSRFLAATVDGWRPDDEVAVGTAYVWDLRDSATPQARIPLAGSDQALAFSADGSRLYTVPDTNVDTRSRPVAVWDAGTGRRMRGLRDRGYPMVLAADDSVLAYADGRDVVLALPATGERRVRLSGHQQPVEHLALSRSGELLATAGADQTVVVWDVDDARVLERVALEGDAMAFSPDERDLYVQTAAGLHVVDLIGNRRYLRQTRPPDPREYLEGGTSFVPSPDGSAVVQGVYHADGTCSTRLIELSSGRTTDLGQFSWTVAEDRAVSWRPDGERVAIVDFAGRVRVFDRATGAVLGRGRVDARLLDAWVEYTADSGSLLAGSANGMVVLDAETIQRVGPALRFPGRNVAFALAGREAGTAVVLTRGLPTNFWDFTDAQTWALVELATGDVLREGSVDFPIESAAVSPDGRRLALGGQPLAVVDLRSGKTSSSNQGSAAAQSHLHWSPDGSTVVSAGDGRVHLWDGATGEPLGDVAFGGDDASPIFLSDSRTVLIPSHDGAVYEWDISVDHALEVACRVGGGGLSLPEWSAVLPEQPFEETCRSG